MIRTSVFSIINSFKNELMREDATPILNILGYYFLFSLLTLIFHSLVIALAISVHFLLYSNLKEIGEWIFSNEWFLISISKIVAIIFTYHYIRAIKVSSNLNILSSLIIPGKGNAFRSFKSVSSAFFSRYTFISSLINSRQYSIPLVVVTIYLILSITVVFPLMHIVFYSYNQSSLLNSIPINFELFVSALTIHYQGIHLLDIVYFSLETIIFYLSDLLILISLSKLFPLKNFNSTLFLCCALSLISFISIRTIVPYKSSEFYFIAPIHLLMCMLLFYFHGAKIKSFLSYILLVALPVTIQIGAGPGEERWALLSSATTSSVLSKSAFYSSHSQIHSPIIFNLLLENFSGDYFLIFWSVAFFYLIYTSPKKYAKSS